MTQFLVFTVLFPPIALVVFNAPDLIAGRFNMMDLTSLQMAYAIAVVPAWLLAGIDRWLKRSWKTASAGAALSYVVAFCIGFPFEGAFATLMVGLVGGAPAAVCSWLAGVLPRQILAS